MKQLIKTKKAPAAIGTYSQAIKVENTVYLSGQIPLNPGSMLLVEGDITLQIECVLKNLQAVAEEAGVKFRPYRKVIGFFNRFDPFKFSE